MILTGENRSTGGQTCHSATLCTTNLTWTGLGSDLGLRCERLATDRLLKLNAAYSGIAALRQSNVFRGSPEF
jgi:hypothetical protein